MILFKSGLYRHFKGALYIAECVVLNVTSGPDEGTKMVLYWALSEGPTKKYARSLEEFLEPVKWADNVARPRFLLEEIH